MHRILSNTQRIVCVDIAKTLGKSVITIHRGLKVLNELGLVERVGSCKTGFWKVI